MWCADKERGVITILHLFFCQYITVSICYLMQMPTGIFTNKEFHSKMENKNCIYCMWNYRNTGFCVYSILQYSTYTFTELYQWKLLKEITTEISIASQPVSIKDHHSVQYNNYRYLERWAKCYMLLVGDKYSIEKWSQYGTALNLYSTY